MKTQKGIREHDADELRKAKRLEPIRKSGKERHALYSSFDEEDEEEILPPKELLEDYYKKRAALDHEIDKTLAEIQRILGFEIEL